MARAAPALPGHCHIRTLPLHVHTHGHNKLCVQRTLNSTGIFESGAKIAGGRRRTCHDINEEDSCALTLHRRRFHRHSPNVGRCLLNVTLSSSAKMIEDSAGRKVQFSGKGDGPLPSSRGTRRWRLRRSTGVCGCLFVFYYITAICVNTRWFWIQFVR